jgi:sialic acid synthase SpsE
MKSEINISHRTIGPNHPTFLIAEIGVNHDGSLQRAMELVDAAAQAGADAVKLQIFQAKNLVHQSGVLADYQKRQTDAHDPTELLRKYELSRPQLQQVVAAIRNKKMVPLATPFSIIDVATLAELDLPAVKIASPDLVNKPLLREAARLKLPLLVSTGAATMSEVAQAVDWISDWGNPLVLLHCISSYPAPIDQANLCWIGELAGQFGVPVGYSDHCTEILSGALAVAAGACVIEKHLTYDRSADGPDHTASADPEQFAEYARQIRLADRLRGSAGKHVLDCERDVRTVSRQSVVLAQTLEADDIVRPTHLTVQRPGTGIPAALTDQLIGKKADKRLVAGTLLQWDMFRDAA